jgi:hypothetical protein
VRGHFVSVGVQVLHLAVVGPFVRHVEGGGDGAAVGVDASALKQRLVQALVQVVDGVVEGEQHDLRDLFGRESSGNFLAAAVAVGQQAHVLAAFGSGLINAGRGVDGLRTKIGIF